MSKIKVAIAEDYSIIRKGITQLLKSNENIELTQSSEDGKVLIEEIDQSKNPPDVILMDIEMPVMDGFETTKLIVEKYPNTKIIYLTSHLNSEFLYDAVQNGGHGYITKDTELETLVDAIDEVYHKGFYFNEHLSFEIVKNLLANKRVSASVREDVLLTPREIEFVRLLCKEKTDQQIANIMCISALSAETYRKIIMKKLGVKKSIGVVVYAVKNKLF